MGNTIPVANEAIASNNINYKSRLEWKMCVVSAVAMCKF